MKDNDNVKKKRLSSVFSRLIFIIICVQFVSIIVTFILYKNNSNESLYYNNSRILCSDKINEIKNNFYSKDYHFTKFKYPYAVIDNSGKVLYSSKILSLGTEVNLESFLQFDKSSEARYKGYIKNSFPIVINGRNEGFFVVLIDESDVKKQSELKQKEQIIFPEIMSLILTAVVLITYKRYMDKKVVKPIVKITESSKDIIKGKLDNYVKENNETEIGELSYAFELMRDEVKNRRDKEMKLKKAQSEVIAAISHDLKTPLAAIRIYVEAIRDGMAETAEDRQEYTSIILKKVDRLTKLIDDLLENSKESLDAITINKQEVSIKEFFSEIASEIMFELSSVNGELKVQGEIPDGIIEIDKLRISQVMFNLISNSIKYASGKLIIKFKVEIKDKHLYVYVEDNGQGILAEDAPYIFNKFYRGDKSRNSSIPGSGLGLSTCKYIVEKHSGEIYYKSLKTKGSLFYFCIPLS